MVAGLQHARRPGVVKFRQRTGADCSKYPGHKWDPTLGYARLYDGTVAANYYGAMALVERLHPHGAAAGAGRLLA
jgi:hypothetical protein